LNQTLDPVSARHARNLEKEGQVQLSQEHRTLLLSMSAVTVDRLLQAHRSTHPHGLSTTKAGPLLKQQIPIRTFAQWDDVFWRGICWPIVEGD
jgi:hypothetical protein